MKRAPFFAEILERQRRNPRFSWRLIAAGTPSERWRRAQLWMRAGWPGGTLLLPDTDPLSIRWPPGSCVADISGLPGALAQRLAQAVLRCGVEHVLFVDVADPTRTMHVKPLPQRVAA